MLNVHNFPQISDNFIGSTRFRGPHHILLQMYFSLNVTLLLFLAPFHIFSFLFSSPHFLGDRLPMKCPQESRRKLQNLASPRTSLLKFAKGQLDSQIDRVGKKRSAAKRCVGIGLTSTACVGCLRRKHEFHDISQYLIRKCFIFYRIELCWTSVSAQMFHSYTIACLLTCAGSVGAQTKRFAKIISWKLSFIVHTMCFAASRQLLFGAFLVGFTAPVLLIVLRFQVEYQFSIQHHIPKMLIRFTCSS